MRGSEYIAEWIQAADVDTIFLVPTNLFASLVELHARDPSVRLVLCHSEKAAAYMADGYAQAAGKPGFVITQAGPGGTNLVAGLAEPYQSGTPVIALTGISDTRAMRGNNYQEITSNFGSTVKFDADVLSADRLPDLLGTALREATTGAPGPVHLGIGPAVERGEIEAEPPETVPCTRYPAYRPAAEPEALAQAAALLRDAQRPVIIAGGGAMRSGAWPEVQELAERLSIPVGTSLSAKAVIADDNPLAIGPVGSYSRRVANEVVLDADLALYVGAHAGGQLTNGKTVPAPGTPVIQVDINPTQIGKNMPVTVGLIGDAKRVMAQLIDVVDEVDGSEWATEAARRVREWWTEQEAYVNSDASPIEPHRLARDVSRHLPDDALVVADTGYAASWAAAYMSLPAGNNFLRCEGSLGWAFPAAMGAKCAVPERPVVCWTGDGGIWYHLGELETAIRCAIPTVTVVLNNHGLKFDTHLLDYFYGEQGKDSYVLSEFTESNFANIAEAMRAWARRVESPEEIVPALEEAIASGQPAVLDVAISDAVAPVRVFEQYASG